MVSKSNIYIGRIWVVVWLIAMTWLLSGCGTNDRQLVAQLTEYSRSAIGKDESPYSKEILALCDSAEQNLVREKRLVTLMLMTSSELFNRRDYTNLIIYNTRVQDLIDKSGLDKKRYDEEMVDLQLFKYAAYQQLGMNESARAGYELLADRLEGKKDMEERLSVIYTNLSNVYTAKNDYLRSIETQMKSLSINQKHNDTIGLVYNYNNLAAAYANLSDNEKAIEYRFLALHLLTNPNDSVLICSIMRNLSTNYTRMKEYSMAEKYLIPAMRFYEKNGAPQELAVTYSKYADIMALSGREGQAREYFSRANELLDDCTPTEQLMVLEPYFSFISGSVSSAGAEDAKRVLTQIKSINDSIASNGTEQTLQSVIGLYNAEIESAQSDVQNAQSTRRMMLILLIGVCAICAAAFGWLTHRVAVQRRHIAISGQRIEKLQEETIALNESVDANKAFLKDTAQELLSLQRLLEIRNTKESRMELRRITSKVMTKADAETVNLHTSEANEAFHRTLLERYPALTVRDLKLCSLIVRNYTTKEIAELLCREVRSVEAARSRLRKKCDIPAGADLYTFFIGIKHEDDNNPHQSA